jgi:hypothetical protein
MSKRHLQSSLQEKGIKRRKDVLNDRQRTLESFFRKRQFSNAGCASESPIECNDNNEGNSTARVIEIIPDDSERDLLRLENVTKSDLCSPFQCQSNISVPGSSVVDAVSTDEIQPLFATSMYTDEFEKILETVFDGEKYLFTEEELQIAEKHRELHVEAKHLFVRIFLRKHQWIRLQRSDYSRNIADINRAKRILCSPHIKFARDESELVELSHLLDILLVEELKTLIQIFRVPVVKSSQQNVGIVHSRFD